MFRITLSTHAMRTTRATCLLLCAVLVGCDGSKLASVKGKVSFGGKPVPGGTVNFIPLNSGPTASGEIKSDGSYALTTNVQGDGAAPGSYKVVIVAMEDQAGKLPEDRNPLPAALIPVRYTSLATTDLTATVDKKENTINFELSK
ncbi:MAG: hypothetical protein ABL921_17035 [Pirellula sp.]